MKLKYDIDFVNVAGEQMAIPQNADPGQFWGTIRMNRTGAFILKQLQFETSAEAILRAMSDRYDADEAALLASLNKVLDILRREDLLCE